MTRADREGIASEYAEAGREFARLLAALTSADLDAPSEGTRWTNRQLLFHLLFGYLIVLRLLVIVRIVGRMPRPFRRAFAAVLNACTRPFDAINYCGSCWGVRIMGTQRMGRQWQRVTAALLARLAAEPEADLGLWMPFPTRWDPFFTNHMTLEDVYRYPTRHFWFHHRQLSRT